MSLVVDSPPEPVPSRETLLESLHGMLIQHTTVLDGYHEALALSANFEAMFLLVIAGRWEWHPKAGEDYGRMCLARPKKD